MDVRRNFSAISQNRFSGQSKNHLKLVSSQIICSSQTGLFSIINQSITETHRTFVNFILSRCKVIIVRSFRHISWLHYEKKAASHSIITTSKRVFICCFWCHYISLKAFFKMYGYIWSSSDQVFSMMAWRQRDSVFCFHILILCQLGPCYFVLQLYLY